jgi:queuosine precursor transporter
MKHYKFYSIITGLFTACLIISNILDTKLFTFYIFTLPAGIIIFPITYLFGDILTEVYGYANSRKVIWVGFISLLLLVITLQVVEILPAPGFWKNQASFEMILGKVPRIVIASITAYFIGEFVNSFTLAKMKVLNKGNRMSVRFIISTFVGQAVDTILFVLIAFSGTFSFKEILEITFSAWLFKVSWELVALPVTIPVVKWLKKVEQEDYFDIDTNFNPFSLK